MATQKKSVQEFSREKEPVVVPWAHPVESSASHQFDVEPARGRSGHHLHTPNPASELEKVKSGQFHEESTISETSTVNLHIHTTHAHTHGREANEACTSVRGW